MRASVKEVNVLDATINRYQLKAMNYVHDLTGHVLNWMSEETLGVLW